MDVEMMKRNLEATLSPDQAIRENAEHNIINLRSTDFKAFISLLLTIFCEETEENHPHLITAGVLIKNSLHSNEMYDQFQIESKWMELDVTLRENVKKALIHNFSSKMGNIGILSASSFAAISRIEIIKMNQQGFFSFMNSLLDSNDQNTIAAVYECLGATCTFLIIETSYDFMNDSSVILNSITKKLNPEGKSEINIAALECLINSIEALDDAFTDINNVFSLLKYLTSLFNINEELSCLILECIDKITGLYYCKLDTCFVHLVNFMKSLLNLPSEKINLKIIEFWSVICEIDIEVKSSLVATNLEIILDYLLRQLKKDYEEDDDTTIWNCHKAAASCIEKITELEIDLTTYKPLINFINHKISSRDWVEQTEGIVALGCSVSDKVEDSVSMLKLHIPFLVKSIMDHNLKEPALWALYKISLNNFNFVDPGLILPELIQNTLSVLSENSRHSLGASNLLKNIGIYVSRGRDKIWDHENLLSFFYYDILNSLIRAAENVEIQNFRLRNSIFDSITELITAASGNVIVILNDLLKYLVQKANDYLKYKDTEHFLIVENILSNQVILMQNIILIVKEETLTDLKVEVLEVFLEVLGCRNSYIFGDVYIALSALITKNSYFISNVARFIPFIVRDMRSTDLYIFKGVINFVGDIANTLNQGFLVYSNDIIPEMINCLTSNHITKEFKPTLLSIFGDVALSMGTSFLPYLDMTINILDQIMNLQRKFNEQFVDNVRKNAIQMFDCVLISLDYQDRVRNCLDGLSNILEKVVVEDEENNCQRECVGLIGDVIRIYGVCGAFRGKWIGEYLNMVLTKGDENVRDSAKICYRLWLDAQNTS